MSRLTHGCGIYANPALPEGAISIALLDRLSRLSITRATNNVAGSYTCTGTVSGEDPERATISNNSYITNDMCYSSKPFES